MAVFTEKSRKAKALFSYQKLNRMLAYDPETGKLTWKQVEVLKKSDAWRNTCFAGKPAGRHHKSGYITIRLYEGGTQLFAGVHQIAFVLMTGEWLSEDFEIDHINCDRHDNRWDNLRVTVRLFNGKNRSMNSRNKSGFKGVAIHQRIEGKYTAQIYKNAKGYYLGTFSCAKEAAKAYDNAAVELHGEFAKTNASMGLL